MELVETIKSRRSIRNYKKKKVAKYLINDLIDMARLAPSAKNRQPWYFVIVQDKLKDQISDLMIEEEEKYGISLEEKIYKAKSSVKATAFIIKKAPILILVFRPKENNWLIGDTLSIGGAIEHICLRATDLGLGSLWIRDIVYTKDKIASLVGKEDMELISAISIGYSKDNLKPKPRKKLIEILEWYK